MAKVFDVFLVIVVCLMETEASDNGLCTKTEWTTVSNLVSEPYTVQYRKKPCFFKCLRTKTEYRVKVEHRRVPKVKYECCEGYTQNGTTVDSFMNSIPKCDPKCTPTCGNGICVSPKRCICHTGYQFNQHNTYLYSKFGIDQKACQPVCSKPCINGTCVEPETCKCYSGFIMTNVSECIPVCSKGCHNGSCISPEVCQCEYGWELVNNTTCMPKCEMSCSNGSCIAPNTCKCHLGYDLKDGLCQPVCSEPCNYGTCVEPETCKCYSGYVMTNVSECIPVCTNGCHNGNCISPEVCQCEDGWELVNETTCIPKCEISCNNGTCIGPNTCKCNAGYTFSDGSCLPVCSEPCYHGTCVEPETCKCLSGYRMTDVNVCTPVCSKGCPNGSCISPEVCQCEDRWEMVNNTTCMPKCETSCKNGTCIAPNTCKCNLNYDLKDGVCQPICSETCYDGYCVDMCNTLEQGDANFTMNRTDFNSKVRTDIGITVFNLPLDSINGTVSDGSTDVDEDNGDFELITNSTSLNAETFEERHRSSLYWIYYYVIPVLALMTIIAMILIWKRKSIAEHFTGGSYVVAGDQKNGYNNDKIPDIRFSALMERKVKMDTNSY